MKHGRNYPAGFEEGPRSNSELDQFMAHHKILMHRDTLRTPELDDLQAVLPVASPVLLFILHPQDEMLRLQYLRHVYVVPSVFMKSGYKKWSHEEYFDKPSLMKTLFIIFSLCIRANTGHFFKSLIQGK